MRRTHSSPPSHVIDIQMRLIEPRCQQCDGRFVIGYHLAMQVIADQSGTTKLVAQLAQAIGHDQQASDDSSQWALVGIRSRGDVLAERVAEKLSVARVGTLDITLYRDDLSEIGPNPIVRTTEVPFAIDGLNIVLVDDVLMTGRSVRAALASLMDLGRPKRVWLSVLVDRGGRELPIQPDHVGLDLSRSSTPVRREDRVEVLIRPTDDQDAVIVRHTDRNGE